MSIQEMKEYIALCIEGESSIPKRKVILEDKRKKLEEEMQRIQDSIDYIDWKQNFYDDVLSGKIKYYNFDMVAQCAMDKKIPENLDKIKADIENHVCRIEKSKFKDKMIHKGYLAMVKHQDETVWAKFKVMDNCVGCGVCAKLCPANAIDIENGKAVHTLVNCQACYACVHACPQKAIGFTIDEKNPNARYRNENVMLEDIIKSNE